MMGFRNSCTGSEAVARRCSVNKVVFKNFAKLTEKRLCLRPASLLKKTQAQVFSCEFCEIFQNIFFHRTTPVAASAGFKFVIGSPEVL